MSFKNPIYIALILGLCVLIGIFWSFSPAPGSLAEGKTTEAPATPLAHFWSWFTGDDVVGSSSKPTKQAPAGPVPSGKIQPNLIAANQPYLKRPAPDAMLMNSSPSAKEPDYLGGEDAHALVKVDGNNYQLDPNQGGDFGRIVMGAKSTAQVQIAYPQANPTDPVIIEAEDGGVLGGGSVTQGARLDNSRQVAFNFQSGTEDGIYRVTLRQGSDMKQIDFWVGAVLPVRH